MTIIRLRDCPPQRWKNGHGSTRELAVQTSMADDAGFVWRASIATVDSAAPFSCFPGIDRQIALLDGAGFRMTLDQQHVHDLTTLFAPFAFAGEAAVTVQLHAGPTRDFNLMTRRDTVHGELSAMQTSGELAADSSLRLVYCANGAITTAEGELQAGDSWRLDSSAAPFVVHNHAVALLVRIWLR